MALFAIMYYFAAFGTFDLSDAAEALSHFLYAASRVALHADFFASLVPAALTHWSYAASQPALHAAAFGSDAVFTEEH